MGGGSKFDSALSTRGGRANFITDYLKSLI